jgi:hypothetical protein
MHSLLVSQSDIWLLTLSAFAGAVHMLAPDHWMPLSLSSWQRKWGMTKTVMLSLLALSFHLAFGFLIYLAIRPVLLSFESRWLFPLSVALVVLAAALRSVRFNRIREVLRLGSNRIWGAVSVLSLLGPCESLIPVMVKGHNLGMGYLSAAGAFAFGTVIAGVLVIMLGRSIWNHPSRLNQIVCWALRRRSVVPAALGVAIGIVFILKL